MKKINLKKLILLVMLLFFMGCGKTVMRYYYQPKQNTETKIYEKYIKIRGSGNEEKKGTLLRYIDVSSLKKLGKNTKYGIKVLSDKVKVVYEGRDYYFNPETLEYGSDEIYTLIRILTVDIDIKKGFKLYLGKVVVDNKLIIDMPVIEFQEWVHSYKENKVLNALYQTGKKDIEWKPVE